MKGLHFARVTLLALGLALVQATASAQAVTTIARSGESGRGDGIGAKASFWNPQGLAVDPEGNVYVADTGSLKIRKITQDGLVTTLAGNGYPGYDDGRGSDARFFGPLGVAADASGNVWVADQDDGIDGQYIKKITPDLVVHNLVLYLGSDPQAVAVAPDASGFLFVSDAYLGLWSGVAVDGAGNAYVTDRDNNRIRKIVPDGTETSLAGSGNPGSADGTGTEASFRGPTGLALDSVGNVYVADRGNHTIRRITPTGIVTTVAGSGSPGSADGIGTAASFNLPAGVALDGSGNLYVADSGNNKIRKITLQGEQLSGLDIRDLWVTPEGETGYLAATSSGIALGTLDASGNATRQRTYGPYDQWAPAAAACSLDGLSRVLWQNADGRWDVWLVGPDGVLGSFAFPADPGLTAEDVAGAQAGITHVLLRGARDAALETVDAQGIGAGRVSLGSYPGWTAAAISDGNEGLTRVLWTNTDGRFGLSLASSSGILQTSRYRQDGVAVDVAAGGDGRTRILHVSSDGRVGLWIVDGSGALVTIGPTYPPPSGFAPRRLSAGQDGSARVLFTDPTRASVIWLLSPDGVLQGSIDLARPTPPTSMHGNRTGTFDSADFVDCDSGTPAQAKFTQDGENVVGTLNAPKTAASWTCAS